MGGEFWTWLKSTGTSTCVKPAEKAHKEKRRRTTKYVFTCSTVTPLGVSSAVSESDQVRRKALLPAYTASMGVGAAPANEPTFKMRPFLLYDIACNRRVSVRCK